jgi:parallel beta-helix repeat protein
MLTTPEDGMTLTGDTTFAPGVYFVPNGIEIAADDITLDGNGALLVGDGFKGQGVRLNRRSGVTIRNLAVERFYHGIYASSCSALTLEHNRITRTHELDSPTVFLDVWLEREEAYGGAIFLNRCIDSRVDGNDVQHQQGGIILYGCDHIAVIANNASYNSGYGMLLFESSDNEVRDNIADFCSRIYQSKPGSETYHNGADAAGLVMMSNASRNRIVHNMLRSGGDGVFLGGFNKEQIKVPCSDNLFENNDGSFSPNIAFEATFSQRNVFRNNRADACNYGFWLGWSSHTTVEGNRIEGNRIAGVAIEHGFENVITGNRFDRNRVGVQLWVNPDDRRGAGTFRQFFPDGADTHHTRITRNTFERHDRAIHVWTERGTAPAIRCRDLSVTDNQISDNRIGVHFERVRDADIGNNDITGNIEAGVKLVGCADVATDGNRLD